MPSLQEIAEQSRRQSLTQREKEFRLLDALLVHGNDGTADLSGKRHDEGVNFLKILLLTEAFNNMWMGREAAVTGYPVQAMALCRCALEDWATLGWVDKHPDDENRWLWDIYEEYEQPTDYAPKFKAMFDELGESGRVGQEAYETLSKFAHPRSTGLRWLIHAEGGNTYFHAGSYFSLVDLDTNLYFLIMIAQMLLSPVADVQEVFNHFDEKWIHRGQQLTTETTETLIRMNQSISSRRAQ